MIVADGPAPYAPAAAVLSVIERHRKVGLPQIDIATLQRIGVSDSLVNRTLQSLRLLGLVEEDGKPSDSMEKLRKAPTSDYRDVLAEILRTAYGSVFEILDPTIASAEDLEDAFRHFTPAGQRGRMVSLFTALLAEAGLVADAVRKKPGPRPARPMNRPKATGSVTASKVHLDPDEPTHTPVSPKPSDDGDTYAITLDSGGTVAVVVKVNLFQLSGSDRAFVLDIVDKLTGYTGATPAAEGGDGLPQ